MIFKLNFIVKFASASASFPWEKDGETFHTKKKKKFSIFKLVAWENQPFNFTFTMDAVHHMMHSCCMMDSHTGFHNRSLNVVANEHDDSEGSDRRSRAGPILASCQYTILSLSVLYINDRINVASSLISL